MAENHEIQLNNFTRNLMAKFPSWMKMAKDQESVGAQFLDVFGLTLDEFKREFDEVVDNFYINTAHLDIIDLLYKVPLTTAVVSDTEPVDEVLIIHHDGSEEEIYETTRLREFYSRDAQLPSFYVDRASGYLYLRVNFEFIEDKDNPYRAIQVNGAPHYTIGTHHVWNVFDEFGLLVGLRRLPRERNPEFKERILDVFENPGSSTKEGIVNGLARELGIEKDRVNIQAFHDQTFGSDMVNPDGTPTEKMVRYAKQVNDQLKFTYDNLNLGESYWYSIEQDNLGIDFLPHIWDVDLSLFKREEFQSGIGHGDDLKVTAPQKQSRTREFKAHMSLIGYYEQVEEFFPEIAFQYKIYAQGKVLEETYEEEQFKYTIDAAEVFEQSYRLVGEQHFPYTMRTEFFEPNDFFDTNDRNNIQFAQSNDFLHTQTDHIVKLAFNFETADVSESNWIPEMQVVWEDTAGNEHTYPFSEQDHYLIPRSNEAGNPETDFAYASISYDSEAGKGLGLGYGAFHHDIDTTVEWQQGTWRTDTVLIRNGEVTLNLDRMRRLMN